MNEIAEKKEIGGLTIENPQAFVSTVTQVADALKSVIEKQKLYAVINNRKFVTCEGWTTLASLCGFIPSVQSVEVYKDGEVLEAKAEAILQKKGVIVAKAIAFCRADEDKFGGKRMQEKYEIASMAQTRAVSKVCRIALSWIMTMAGYEATPAEEIKAEYVEAEIEKPKATEQQLKAIHAILNKMNLQTREEKLKRISLVLGKEISSYDELTKADASTLIENLQKEPF
ncbi:MAG: hypothetical protein QXV73_03985 [Candidatus Micrarchaeia archaeon]